LRRRYYDQVEIDLAQVGGLRIKPQDPLPHPKQIPALYDMLVVFLRHLTPDQLKTLQDAVMSIPKPDARN